MEFLGYQIKPLTLFIIMLVVMGIAYKYSVSQCSECQNPQYSKSESQVTSF